MQNSFTVSPMVQKISLKAGETYHGEITVANPAVSTQDFSFEVTVSPYSVSGAGYAPDFKTMSDWSRIVEWLKLDTTSGTLKPNEKKKVGFTITVPKNAPAGGQYAMIGVSSANAGGDDSTVQNIFEMASLVYAEVEGETRHGGEIVSNEIPGFVSVGVPITKITLTNTGNVHETAEINLKVKDVFSGNEIALTDDGKNTYEAIVMPDTTRELTREINGLSQLGIFEVTQDVNYMGQNAGLTTIMVICPIWFIALVAATILSVIGMVFYGVHLRKKKRASFEKAENEKISKN